MDLHRIKTGVSKFANGIKRLAKLERVLAVVCISIPILLFVFDDYRIRESISAYYDMHKAQVFYFPLSVAAMLFVVNGVVKQKNLYNIYLGLMLAGIILFNHIEASLLHNTFAAAFFGGNALVMLFFSSKKETWFKSALVFVIVLSMAGCCFFHWFTLFWAEWISFAIIAIHYIIES
jgi:hypothetical protein